MFCSPNFFKSKSGSTAAVAGSNATVKAGAIPASNGTPVSAGQLKAALAQVALILGGTLPTDIEGKLGASIKDVSRKLDEFTAEATKPKNLQGFETQTKALDALFETAQKHIISVVQAAGAEKGSSITPNQLRSYETTAFYTLKAEFNAEKQKLGAGLVQKDMVAIQTKLAELNPNTKLSNFLTAATACSKQIKALEDVIGKTDLKNTPSLESLKEKLRAKFDGQLPMITGSEMDVTEIAVTANLVHGLICGDPDLKVILTPTGSSSSSETWLDKFQTQMNGQFNTKAEAMKREIDRKLTSSDVDGASALLSKLSASVLSATESKSHVAGADGTSSASDNVFNGIGAATTALKDATKAVAVHTLTTAVAKETAYLSGADAISAAVLKDPGAEAEKLRGRIANLESLATAATDAGNTPPSTGTKELTDILTVAEALQSVATAKDVADELLKTKAKPTLEAVNSAIAEWSPAPAVQVLSASPAHAAVTTLTTVLEAKCVVNADLLVQLKALKRDLEAAGKVDEQTAKLAASSTDTVLTQLKASVASGAASSSTAGKHESDAKKTLETAQKAVVAKELVALDALLTKLPATVELSDELSTKVTSATAKLGQLADSDIKILMDATQTIQVSTIKTKLSEMTLAIQDKVGKVIGTAHSSDGQRLKELTNALKVCTAAGLSSTAIPQEIETTVKKVTDTVDKSMTAITTAATTATTATDLTSTIRQLNKVVSAALNALEAVPDKKAEFLQAWGETLESSLKTLDPTFTETGVDRPTQMANGFALIKEMATIGNVLGKTDWPTGAMNTQVADKLKTIVSDQFGGHHPLVDLDGVTLDKIAEMRAGLATTSGILGGPNTEQIKGFVKEVVGDSEANATKEINLAEIKIAIREVKKAADAGESAPVDLPLMQKCEGILKRFKTEDAAKFIDNTDMSALDAEVKAEVDKLPNLIGPDARMSTILKALTDKLRDPKLATDVMLSLVSLKVEGSHPRTDGAMAQFIAELNNSSLKPEDKIPIRKQLLLSDIVTSAQKSNQAAMLATELAVGWGKAMTPTNVLPSLTSQLQDVKDMGLEGDYKDVLLKRAWETAAGKLPEPTKEMGPSVETIQKLMTETPITDGPTNTTVETFVAAIRLEISKDLGDKFGKLFKKEVVGESSFARSERLGTEFQELVKDFKLDVTTEGKAASLTKMVNDHCVKLLQVPMTDHGTALEKLFEVKCMMDKLPIDGIKADLKTKTDELLALLKTSAKPELSLDHVKMFQALAGQKGIDGNNVEAARTKVVKSWGTNFATRATAASSAINAPETSFGALRTSASSRFKSSGAPALLAEWEGFKGQRIPDTADSPVTGIRSTMGYLQVRSEKTNAADKVTAAIRRAIKPTLTKEDVVLIVKELEADVARVKESADAGLIPESAKGEMKAKVGTFFTIYDPGVTHAAMRTAKIRTVDIVRNAPIQALKAEFVELTDLAERFKKVGGNESTIDAALIKLDKKLTDLGKVKANMLGAGTAKTDTSPVTTAAALATVRTTIQGEADKIDKVAGDIVTHAAKIVSSQKAIVDALSAVPATGKGDKGALEKLALEKLTPKIGAYFEKIKITAANIDHGDATQLDAVQKNLDGLKDLTAEFGADTVRDAAKAPILPQLAAARVLNAVKNIANGGGMENLAVALANAKDVDITKSSDALYADATGTAGTATVTTPLNKVIAQKAVEGDPDEHKLAVMAQVLRLSNGADVGDLTVDKFDEKMKAFVSTAPAPAPVVGVSDEDAMKGKLGRLKDFLAGVGDGVAVQSLPAGVKEKIIGLVGELGVASTTGVWASCTALVDTLKTTLGATAEQIAWAAAMKAFDDAAGTRPADVKAALEGLQAAKAAIPAADLPSDAKGKIEAKLRAIVVPACDLARPNDFADQIKAIKEAYDLGNGLGVGLGADEEVATALKEKIHEKVTKFQTDLLASVNAAVKVSNSLTAPKFQRLIDFTTACGGNAEIKKYPQSVQIAIVGVAEDLLGVVREDSNSAVTPKIELLRIELDGVGGIASAKFYDARERVRTRTARFIGMFSSSTAISAGLPSLNPLSSNHVW